MGTCTSASVGPPEPRFDISKTIALSDVLAILEGNGRFTPRYNHGILTVIVFGPNNVAITQFGCFEYFNPLLFENPPENIRVFTHDVIRVIRELRNA